MYECWWKVYFPCDWWSCLWSWLWQFTFHLSHWPELQLHNQHWVPTKWLPATESKWCVCLLHWSPPQDPIVAGPPHATNQSVCEFTLAEFSKCKQLYNLYHSPPFCTHPQGYKLCLSVHANVDGRGLSTHVSVCATLMRREHDQHLQWPLTVEFVIELLNWREDKEHHNKTVPIDSSDDYVRVTEGMYG